MGESLCGALIYFVKETKAMRDNNMQENSSAKSSLEEIARQRDEARQQAEADAAQKMLQEMKDTETPAEPSDAEKRRAHEETEAKRRAQWEAEKQKRDDEIQFAWEEAVSVSDEELQKNSVKRLGDMTERLTRHNMKICVTENIQTLCYEDLEFARLVMHPRKSMINCFKYINRKALEYLKQEMKDNGEKTTGVGAIGGDVPDDLCYLWAEEYFRDLNAQEDKTDADKEFVAKPYTGSAGKGKKKEPKKKADAPKKAPAPKKELPPVKAPETEDQIDLFEGQQSLFGEAAA